MGPVVRLHDPARWPAQRDALLPLATSGSDALQRLSAVLPYAHVPDAVGARCRAGRAFVSARRSAAGREFAAW